MLILVEAVRTWKQTRLQGSKCVKCMQQLSCELQTGASVSLSVAHLHIHLRAVMTCGHAWQKQHDAGTCKKYSSIRCA